MSGWGDCIEWTGRIDVDGYGRTSEHLAHRVEYERLVGPIPDGYQIDHLCRNRACVNVAHLEAVTPRENAMRSRSFVAVNASKTHCNGHPFDAKNTRIDTVRVVRDGGTVWTGERRSCRACDRDRQRAYKQRLREKEASA